MESRKRTIIKAMSYRGMVTMILAALSWTFTSNAQETTVITVVYAVLATVGYYGHERIWNKIAWERNKTVHLARSNSKGIIPKSSLSDFTKLNFGSGCRR